MNKRNHEYNNHTLGKRNFQTRFPCPVTNSMVVRIQGTDPWGLTNFIHRIKIYIRCYKKKNYAINYSIISQSYSTLQEPTLLCKTMQKHV